MNYISCYKDVPALEAPTLDWNNDLLEFGTSSIFWLFVSYSI